MIAGYSRVGNMASYDELLDQSECPILILISCFKMLGFRSEHILHYFLDIDYCRDMRF